MDYNKYLLKYKNIIYDYKNNNKNYEEFYIFEVLYAIKLGLILWEDIPPGFEEIYNLPHKRDYGIDLISLQFDKTSQVKMYNNSLITWSDMCKYNCYSKDILEIKDLTLATTTTAKIDKMVQRLFKNENYHILRNNFDDMLKNTICEYTPIEKIKPKNIEERHYLLDCYDLIINSNKKELRLQLPCGTGKTFIILYTIIQLLKINNSEKFIIFVPWIDLAEQTFNLFKNYNINTLLIGNGNHSIVEPYNVIICVNPSVEHIPTNIKFKYQFQDESHHLENKDSKIKKI